MAYSNPGNGTWAGNGGCVTPNPAWDDEARHSGGNEIGFADGHVGYKKTTQTTGDLYGPH